MDYREQLQQSRTLNQTAAHSQAVVAAVTQDNESLQSALEQAISDIAERDATIAQQTAQLADKDARIAELEQKIRDMIAQKPNITVKTNHGVISGTIQNLHPACPSLSITTTEQLQSKSTLSSSRTRRLSQIHQPALAPSL